MGGGGQILFSYLPFLIKEVFMERKIKAVIFSVEMGKWRSISLVDKFGIRFKEVKEIK